MTLDEIPHPPPTRIPQGPSRPIHTGCAWGRQPADEIEDENLEDYAESRGIHRRREQRRHRHCQVKKVAPTLPVFEFALDRIAS